VTTAAAGAACAVRGRIVRRLQLPTGRPTHQRGALSSTLHRKGHAYGSRPCNHFLPRGSLGHADYKTEDLDAVKTAFLAHLTTGDPAFVELTSLDAQSLRSVIIRLSTVRSMEFGRLRD
jgi:hypothetical protein